MPRTSAPLPTVTTPAIATTATSAHVKTQLSSSIASRQPPSSIEAKLVILGSQGVGKTSLVNRFLNPHCSLTTSSQATIGASFVTKRIHDPDSNTTVRLQIWDTAGQERFRSISRLYYRGADAGLLCYDVTSEQSWEDMKGWLREMRENCDFANEVSGAGMVIHVVGTKTDLVAADPDSRQVPFERTIAYVAEQLAGVAVSSTSQSSTPPMYTKPPITSSSFQSPDSKRSSGFWTQDLGWDSCHEISAKDNDGIEEVFRVIARKMVEQRNKRDAWEANQTPGPYNSVEGNKPLGDYFSARGHGGGSGGRESSGSFRIGYGDKRRSWLGLASNAAAHDDEAPTDSGFGYSAKDIDEVRRKGRCC